MKTVIIIPLLAVAAAETLPPPAVGIVYLRVYDPKLTPPPRVERAARAWSEAMPASCGKRFAVVDKYEIGEIRISSYRTPEPKCGVQAGQQIKINMSNHCRSRRQAVITHEDWTRARSRAPAAGPVLRHGADARSVAAMAAAGRCRETGQAMPRVR